MRLGSMVSPSALAG
uniref:Uncharacterized protein n=1 Tax=Arundo donax TaxID=35708 RepID=A0A0A9F2N4_ARUDO